MSSVFLRGVSVEALAEYWERERPAAATVQSTPRGKWLYIMVVGADPDSLAARLSRDFAQEARSHWERNSAGASGVTVWRRGAPVRKLVCAEYRWEVVEGEPRRWESALPRPPVIGEEGPGQYELLDAIDMNRGWRDPMPLEGPADDDGSGVGRRGAAVFVGVLLLVCLYYLFLR